MDNETSAEYAAATHAISAVSDDELIRVRDYVNTLIRDRDVEYSESMKLKLEIDFADTTMRTGRDVLNAVAQSLSLPFNQGQLFVGQTSKLRDAFGGTVGQWSVE